MEISEVQKLFNTLNKNQSAASTIKTKLALSNTKFKQMLEIYIEYERYLQGLQIISDDENQVKLNGIYSRILELINLMRYCTDKAKYLEYEQEYEDLVILYSETDIYEPIKIQIL